MKIAEIKKRMLAWKDIYGGDIPWAEDIKKAKTKADLEDCLNRFNRLLEDTAQDAIGDCDEFRKELGLSY